MGILIIAIVLAVVCWVICDKFNAVFELFVLISSISAIVAVGLIFISIFANIGTDAKIERLNAEREVLVYQLENETYMNDNNLGAHELFSDIGDFNANIRDGRLYRKSFMTNILYSSKWNYVEPIELPED